MEKTIGRVTHYFDHMHAAAVKLYEPLKVGETIHVPGKVREHDEVRKILPA